MGRAWDGFGALIGLRPRNLLAFLFFLVSALAVLMVILVLVAYAGVHVDALRGLWTSSPADSVKVASGLLVFFVFLGLRFRSMGTARRRAEAEAEAEEAAAIGEEEPEEAAVTAEQQFEEPAEEVAAPFVEEKAAEDGDWLAEEPDPTLHDEATELPGLPERAEEGPSAEDEAAGDRLLEELASTVAGAAKAPPPPLRPEVPAAVVDRKREMRAFLLGVPGVSRRAAEAVSSFFQDLDQVARSDASDIAAIREVAPGEARLIVAAVRKRLGAEEGPE